MVAVNYIDNEAVLCRTLKDIDRAIRRIRYREAYVHSIIYVEAKQWYNVVYYFDEHFDFLQDIGVNIPGRINQIHADGGSVQFITHAHTIDARACVERWTTTQKPVK